MSHPFRKERFWAWLNSLAYMIGWFLTAYGIDEHRMGFLGMPLWFECSCLYMPVGFVLSSFLIIHYGYSNTQDR